MRIIQISSFSEWEQIIRTNPNAHFVCPAWISKDSSLTTCATTMGLCPQYNGIPPNISGLSGRSFGASQDPWHKLWSLCDKVNERFETGTLLPSFPITLIPAFTVTFGYIEFQAKRAIEDVFLAHTKFAPRNDKIIVMISWGRQLERELEHFIITEFNKYGCDVEIVMPPLGSNCHWTAA